MEPRRSPSTSSDIDPERLATPKSQPQNPKKSPRSWLGASPVTFIQCLIIPLSLVTFILCLVPLGDLKNAGEQHELMIYVVTGTSLAYLIALIFNATILAARRFRHAPLGVHANWAFALSILVLLCTMAAVGMIGTFVGVRLETKNNIFLNYGSDWCRKNGSLVTCRDIFYDREPHFITLLAFSIIVMIMQGFLACIWKLPRWNTRRTERQAAADRHF